MRSKLLLLLSVSLFLAFSSKGFSQDVLCVHIDEGFVHVESEHVGVPEESDELHLKLSPELSNKLFKVSLDINLSFDKSLLPLGSFYAEFYKRTFLSLSPPVYYNPISTVRLII